MLATSFRLIILPTAEAPPLHVSFDEVAPVLESAALETEVPIEVTPDKRPRFALHGEFPAGAEVVEGPGLSVTVEVPLVGFPFTLWLRRFEAAAAAGLRARGLESQSDPALGPALWAFTDPFGNRQQALALINRAAFAAPAAPARVNVVIVDQGFDASLFPPGNFAGGISVNGKLPGQGTSGHAAMIARNVLSVAPRAKLYDCPLIPTAPAGAPQTLGNVVTFTSFAAPLCDWVATPLVLLSNLVGFGSWVFVNAWAMFDRRTDVGPIRYADNPNHALNRAVTRLVGAGCDVVFAAGNCGQFDPDGRCSFDAIGPGQSILGANSLRQVITVGAIRTSATPLGYCAQGPGSLAVAKPDLCAPSEFTEVDDKAEVNGGSSAASGLVGGVVAALRGKWPVFGTGANARTPAQMQAALIASVRKVPAFGSRYGIGAGIVDLAGADAAL